MKIRSLSRSHTPHRSDAPSLRSASPLRRRARLLLGRNGRPSSTLGMTLVEIMVVVIIIVLIATAVGVAVMPQFEKARVKSTITDATTIRSAVQLYRLDNNDCPTVEELVEADTIDRTTRTVDAWENGFVIECEGNDIYVVSAGPDGQMGTEDDIDNTGQSAE